MTDELQPIPGFPDYRVYSKGIVESLLTSRVLRPSVNPQGHLKVNLMRDHEAFTRSVNQLVGRAFLPKPPRYDFTNIIHLDGDKTNCAVSNLAWRPRYFAVKYHNQFNTPIFKKSAMPIKDVKTGEVYETIQAAVKKHGLLFTDILVAMHSRTFTWPGYQEFVTIDL